MISRGAGLCENFGPGALPTVDGGEGKGTGGGGRRREEGRGREGLIFIDFPFIMENQWKAYINKSRQTKRKYFFP